MQSELDKKYHLIFNSSGKRTKSRKKQKITEGGILGLLATATFFSVAVTLVIVFVLGFETFNFFSMDEVSVREFFTTSQWNPLLGSEKHFGIWSLICGTFLVAGIALLTAVPAGLVTAVYLSEYAHPKVRGILKPALEILAGIPTVVYGFFALTIITPTLKLIDPGFGSYNALAAGIAVGILILPIVTSLSEDALRAVPQSLREGALGLGATKSDVSVKIVFPAALSGIVSSVLLAAARAIGETMIVALAAGSTPRVTIDARDEIQTMTGFIVQMALGDVSNYGVEYLSMYSVAFTLFVLTFLFTLLGAWVSRKYREVYE
jgi:phosphate transport system permease protein